MTKLPVAAAFFVCAVAGTMTALTIARAVPTGVGTGAVQTAQADPIRGTPRGGAIFEAERPGQPAREAGRRDRDCHRDVRTHRIGSERVRHRHAGENCEVREVRRGEALRP